MAADFAAAVGVAHLAFAAGIDQRHARGQPQVGHQFQIIAGVQHAVRTLITEVAHFGARRIAGGIAARDAHVFRRAAVRQMLAAAQTHRGFAFKAKQGVAARVVQGTADVGVGNLQPVRPLTQVHGVVVVHQPDFQLRIIVQVQRGFVAQPGAAGLRARVVAAHIRRIGGAWVVFDLLFGNPACELVIGFAITQIKACFQLRAETIANIGRDAFAVA